MSEVPAPNREKTDAEIASQISRITDKLHDRVAKLTVPEESNPFMVTGSYNYGKTRDQDSAAYFVGAEQRSVGYEHWKGNKATPTVDTTASAHHIYRDNNDPKHLNDEGNKRTEIGLWARKDDSGTKLSKSVEEDDRKAVSEPRSATRTRLAIEATSDGKVTGNIETKDWETREEQNHELSKQQIITGAASVLSGLRGKIAHAENHRKTNEQTKPSPKPEVNQAAQSALENIVKK